MNKGSKAICMKRKTVCTNCKWLVGFTGIMKEIAVCKPFEVIRTVPIRIKRCKDYQPVPSIHSKE